jgi:RecJ-like exonuclease
MIYPPAPDHVMELKGAGKGRYGTLYRVHCACGYVSDIFPTKQDAERGKSEHATLNAQPICPACEGSGRSNTEAEICPACGGLGRVTQAMLDGTP